MNDPIDEIFNGTPDGIDEDELNQMQAAQQQRQVELQTLEQDLEEDKESSSSTTTESQPKQETQPTATAEEPKEEEEFDLGDGLRTAGEFGTAFGAGALDFGVDVINLIPGVDAPKLPKFHNQAAQTVRELFSIIGPTVGLTATGVGAAGALAKASKLKFLADPFIKWLGTTSLSGGIGAAVDYTSELSEDDNAAGMLKKNFPKTFGFIPDNIATLDGDSPDTKRMKNVVEGVGLGIFTDVLGGVVQLARNVGGVLDSTKWIPESEKAAKWIENNKVKKAEDGFDVAEKGAAKRSADLDDLGAYNFGKSLNLDPQSSQPSTLDTRGSNRQFHGANQDFELSPNAEYGGSMMNIYGDGLYVTDDYETASSYVKKNAQKGQEATGGVYEVTSENQNLYDLNGPTDPDAINYLDDYASTSNYSEMAELVGEALDDNPESLADIMDYMRRNSSGFGIPAHEIQEVFNDVKNIFKNKGFNGYTHVGGMKAGKGKRQHKVNILWDADQNSSMRKTGDDEFMQKPAIDKPMLGVHDLYGYDESGIRSVDDTGIVGAAVDQVRISKNYDSVHGRLGSVLPERAMKFALEGVESYDSVLRNMRDDLAKADRIGFRVSGRTITAAEIEDEGIRFAANLLQMDKDEMAAFLDNFRPDKAGLQLDDVAGKGVRIAIRELMQEFAASSVRADALIRGSLAGQVSDMAQGMRYSEGSAAVPRAQEQILDRLEFLMIQNGRNAYQKGRGLRMLRLKERLSNFSNGKGFVPDEVDPMEDIMKESKRMIDTLKTLSEERPGYLMPLMMAYEATDGSVHSVDALNNYVRNSLGTLSKAFYDGQPEIPSVVMKGFWANVYNSVLSAAATPIKATLDTTVLLVQRPISLMVGALSAGDLQTIRRGFYQYRAGIDTLQKGLSYFGATFRRSGIDPTYSGVAGRESQLIQNSNQMEVLNAFADAKARDGDFGPQAMMAQVEEVQALADHPWLRLGNRLMQATDGLTQAMIGNIEARGKAFDQFTKGDITADDLKKASQDAYAAIWKVDEKGRSIISDEAVRKASGEISMNLDNPANDALSAAIRRVPALKPFLLFTKTPLNMLAFAQSANPLSFFIKQMDAYALPFDQMPVDKVHQLLKARGVPLDENIEQAYNAIRAEMRGRKAMGALAVMGAVGLFLDDRITGNGIYDRQKQQLRRQVDWKPRSIRLPGGEWISYDSFGPIGDWLAFTADVMDNFDVLGEGGVAQYLSASGFVLSASVTDKSMLAGIEPIYDILAGNPAAINRWASSFIPSAVMPGSSALAELGRLISPNLRVVEENLFAMLANRTPLKAALPDLYDYIDGDKINMPDNILSRLYNTYSPWKVNGKISDEKQFLIDIEYDNRPNMKTDGRGTDLTLNEQAEVYRYMGKNGLFKQAIERVMSSVDGKKFREKFREAQRLGKQPRLEDFASVHIMLDRELRLAKEYAISQIDLANGGAIGEREFDQKSQRKENRMVEIEPILNMAK